MNIFSFYQTKCKNLSGARIANITGETLAALMLECQFRHRTIGSVLTGKGGMTMPDMENVIKGMEEISEYFFDIYRNDTDSYKCEKAKEYSDVVIDVLSLLKKQEALEPYSMNAESTYGICPKCGKIVFRYGNVEEIHYCGVCGQKVKWK